MSHTTIRKARRNDSNAASNARGRIAVQNRARRSPRSRLYPRSSTANVSARTGRAPGYPLRSFYAVRLPGDACSVIVRDADRGPLIETGPAAGGRCGQYHVKPDLAPRQPQLPGRRPGGVK